MAQRQVPPAPPTPASRAWLLRCDRCDHPLPEHDGRGRCPSQIRTRSQTRYEDKHRLQVSDGYGGTHDLVEESIRCKECGQQQAHHHDGKCPEWAYKRADAVARVARTGLQAAFAVFFLGVLGFWVGGVTPTVLTVVMVWVLVASIPVLDGR